MDIGHACERSADKRKAPLIFSFSLEGKCHEVAKGCTWVRMTMLLQYHSTQGQLRLTCAFYAECAQEDSEGSEGSEGVVSPSRATGWPGFRVFRRFCLPLAGGFKGCGGGSRRKYKKGAAGGSAAASGIQTPL